MTTIFALPHAGGSAYQYRNFAKYLPPTFKFVALEYAGRGERQGEAVQNEIGEIIEDLLDQIKSSRITSGYVIFGHSLGTLVGYELTKRLRKESMELPKLLFFTGRSAPSIPEKSKISDLDSQKFWESLFEMGGIQQEVIENQELLDYLEPILRADIKVVEKYQYEPLTEPLPVPIAIFGGLTDEDLSQESLDAWQKESTFPLEVSWVAGNHFFIFENPSQIIQELVKKSENC